MHPRFHCLISYSMRHFITKCDSYFIIKSRKILLQNGSRFLLDNVTVSLKNTKTIGKYDAYYKSVSVHENIWAA